MAVSAFSTDCLMKFSRSFKEVKIGFECGITIENFNDLKVGDIMETYEMIEVER